MNENTSGDAGRVIRTPSLIPSLEFRRSPFAYPGFFVNVESTSISFHCYEEVGLEAGYYQASRLR